MKMLYSYLWIPIALMSMKSLVKSDEPDIAVTATAIAKDAWGSSYDDVSINTSTGNHSANADAVAHNSGMLTNGFNYIVDASSTIGAWKSTNEGGYLVAHLSGSKNWGSGTWWNAGFHADASAAIIVNSWSVNIRQAGSHEGYYANHGVLERSNYGVGVSLLGLRNCYVTSVGVSPPLARADFAAVWSISTNPIPGSTSGDPLPPVPSSFSDPVLDSGKDEDVSIPVEVSGSFLVNPNEFSSPVVDDYGTTSTTYFSTGVPAESGEFGRQDTYNPIPLAYLFNVTNDSPRFMSLSLPKLDPTRTYRLWVKGISQVVSGGKVIDFSADHPDGVSRFFIDGLDENAGDGQLPDAFGITFATEGVSQFILADIYPNIGQRFVYHGESSFAAESFEAALDGGKFLAQEGTQTVTLGYENLINSSRGINGLVFHIHNLQTNSLSEEDFLFQVSPSGIFEQESNPPAHWTAAPKPSSITVVPGTPSLVILQWPDNAIANRWLRVSLLANENTRLVQSEVFYLGHLLGETTGLLDETYTVSFADITEVRSQVGDTVDASSTLDINKSGIVTFADITAMRSSIGNQLSNITIPAVPAK